MDHELYKAVLGDVIEEIVESLAESASRDEVIDVIRQMQTDIKTVEVSE